MWIFVEYACSSDAVHMDIVRGERLMFMLKDAGAGQEKVSIFDLLSCIPIGDQRLTLYLGPLWLHLFATRTVGIRDEISIS